MRKNRRLSDGSLSASSDSSGSTISSVCNSNRTSLRNENAKASQSKQCDNLSPSTATTTMNTTPQSSRLIEKSRENVIVLSPAIKSAKSKSGATNKSKKQSNDKPSKTQKESKVVPSDDASSSNLKKKVKVKKIIVIKKKVKKKKKSSSSSCDEAVSSTKEGSKSNASGPTEKSPQAPKSSLSKRDSSSYLQSQVKQKAVSFGPSLCITITYIETLAEICEEGLFNTIWWEHEELKGFKYDAEDEATAVEHEIVSQAWRKGPGSECSHEEHPEEAIRGLECHTAEGHWRAYKARSDVVNAVLDEQDAQRRIGGWRRTSTHRRASDTSLPTIADATTEPHRLAAAAREISRVFATEAAERGKQDALVARRLS